MSEEMGREAIRFRWSLLGEWWCIPVDQTPEEQAAMIYKARDGMLLRGCPDEFIADRMFGGFPCANETWRRHVYFHSGAYSFIAAGEGEFWANDGRRETWRTLLKNNPKLSPTFDGPFTSDAPREGEVVA